MVPMAAATMDLDTSLATAFQNVFAAGEVYLRVENTGMNPALGDLYAAPENAPTSLARIPCNDLEDPSNPIMPGETRDVSIGTNRPPYLRARLMATTGSTTVHVSLNRPVAFSGAHRR